MSWRIVIAVGEGRTMGQVLHGSAKTTHAVRAELQRSQASAAQLARRFGINEKTVRKWRCRETVEDEPMGPKRSEEHTSELQSLMRISYAVFCLNTKKTRRELRTAI